MLLLKVQGRQTIAPFKVEASILTKVTNVGEQIDYGGVAEFCGKIASEQAGGGQCGTGNFDALVI